jgi:TM2 domain-containing membrane protein YozV
LSGTPLYKSSFTHVVNTVILTKSLAITVVLAVIFAGLGHIYLGYKKRGVIILVTRIAIWLAVIWFLPFPIDWIVGPILGGGFWIWQLIDVIRLYNRTRSTIIHDQTQVELRKE